jgi:hypothetical protein
LAVDLKDESAIRAMANATEQAGSEIVAIPPTGATQIPAAAPAQDTAPTPTPQPTAPQIPAGQPAPEGTPAKFVNPDGTVDVNKLQASTAQLDAAMQDKKLTIDEMVAQYKAKEAQFRNLPRSPEQVASYAQQVAQQQPVPPPPQAFQQPMPAPYGAPPDPQAAYQQLMADFQRDPIGTMYDMARQVTQRETKTFQDFIAQAREQQRDTSIKNNLMELAKEDPRVAHPVIYQEIVAELGREPGYLHLQNPHEAAWLKVKARMRLGDTLNQPAQPSKTPAPILGGGTPPPVPSMVGQNNPLAFNQAIQAAKGKDEMKALEQQLRDLAVRTGW